MKKARRCADRHCGTAITGYRRPSRATPPPISLANRQLGRQALLHQLRGDQHKLAADLWVRLRLLWPKAATASGGASPRDGLGAGPAAFRPQNPMAAGQEILRGRRHRSHAAGSPWYRYPLVAQDCDQRCDQERDDHARGTGVSRLRAMLEIQAVIYLYLRIEHLVTACTCKLADQTIAKGDYHRHRTPARLSPFIADRDQNRPRTKPGRCGKAGTPLIFCIFPGLSRFHAWPFSCVLVGLILRASEEPGCGG